MTVKYSTVQYSTVKYSTVHYSTIKLPSCILCFWIFKLNTVTLQYRLVQYNKVHDTVVLYSTEQYSTAQYNKNSHIFSVSDHSSSVQLLYNVVQYSKCSTNQIKLNHIKSGS